MEVPIPDKQSLSAGPQSSFQAIVPPPSVTPEDPEPRRDNPHPLKGLKSGQRGSRTFRTFAPVTTDLTGGLEPECPVSAGEVEPSRSTGSGPVVFMSCI